MRSKKHVICICSFPRTNKYILNLTNDLTQIKIMSLIQSCSIYWTSWNDKHSIYPNVSLCVEQLYPAKQRLCATKLYHCLFFSVNDIFLSKFYHTESRLNSINALDFRWKISAQSNDIFLHWICYSADQNQVSLSGELPFLN